jgi:hypothetical protein
MDEIDLKKEQKLKRIEQRQNDKKTFTISL